MAQTHTIGSAATNVFSEGGFTKVLYHRTVLVKFQTARIILNSGGWRTATTKTRMNQTSNQYGLEFHVFQKDFDWFVTFRGETIPFVDHMELAR